MGRTVFCFGNDRVWGEDLLPVGTFEPSEASAAVCYWGGGSVVVDLLFIGVLCSVFDSCFVVWCLVSFLVLQWSWWGG